MININNDNNNIINIIIDQCKTKWERKTWKIYFLENPVIFFSFQFSVYLHTTYYLIAKIILLFFFSNTKLSILKLRESKRKIPISFYILIQYIYCVCVINYIYIFFLYFHYHLKQKKKTNVFIFHFVQRKKFGITLIILLFFLCLECFEKKILLFNQQQNIFIMKYIRKNRSIFVVIMAVRKKWQIFKNLYIYGRGNVIRYSFVFFL